MRKTPRHFSAPIALLLALFCIMTRLWAGEPLATLQFKIEGTQLSVSPSVLSVPKGIAGSVLVQITSGANESGDAGSTSAENSHVEAILRGPAFEAMRLVGRINEPLMLPPLNLVGDYQLDNIRLVDSQGRTKMEATPSSIPVKVFDEVLVSKVVSRPLTLAEIQEKGITIDEQNFRAIEFEVGFVLDGKTIPVRFPVIAPTFKDSTEIIPAAELEAKLVEAAFLNQQLAGEAQLPPELEQSGLNIHIQGINFQRVDMGEGDDLALQIPPIPALMVIPGNIGFLNQFFSVQIFTENAAPGNSGLSVVNVSAKLILPPGPDRIPATEYSVPGDDPLRFARVGEAQEIQPVQSVVRPGSDGQIGTADDIPRLNPGESGQGEFLVEGLQEGLHVMDLELTADLEGLAAGVVQVKGRAAGSVLVRNPKFSMAFSHPRTVRSGEPYEASVTILNTSPTVANEVSVTLPSTAISGGALESPQTVVVGTINPGETKTATFRIRAQRTGAVTFSNLSTSDDRLVGRFRLKMGIDERGVALSPDTIGMPDYVNDLPTNLVTAANRVLGQALSIATAGQLPPGVRAVPKSIVTRRVLELAESGQRVRYGDPLARVLTDLLLDWQGGREFNAGFDEILRVTDAGSEWRSALMVEIEKLDELGMAERLAGQASDAAGRAESWQMAAVGTAGMEIRLLHGTNVVSHERSGIPQALVYAGQRGAWLVHRPAAGALVEWYSSNELASVTLNHAAFDTNGAGRMLTWELPQAAAGACHTFAPASESSELEVDLNCDGSPDSLLAAMSVNIEESQPELLAVIQDRAVLAGRPSPSCLPAPAQNYGTVLAVLFSKPMVQETINLPSAYQLDNGNTANSVQIQPGGRVALLNMRWPVGAIRARTMTIRGVTDARGNTISDDSQTVESDLTEGTAINGRVVRADGSPAGGIPVTLTMYDQQLTGFAECLPFTVRVSQVATDEAGFFTFDFVLAGIPYSLSATDIGGLAPEAVQLIIEASTADSINRQKLLELANSPSAQNTLLAEFAVGALPEAIAKAEGLDRAVIRDLIDPGSPRVGSETPIALRFRGRGTVSGTILNSDGITPVAAAAVNLFPDPDSRELGRGIYSDGSGRFAFYGVPLGAFSIQATSPGGEARTISDVIEMAGSIKEVTVILSTNRIVRTQLRGRVLETGGDSPHANGQVLVGRFDNGKLRNVVAVATADGEGFWSATVPSGTYDIVALSYDGKRKGDRLNVLAALGSDTQVTITLQGRANVIGRVENSVGQPVPNALVAGGETLVRTDANGFFTMPGVPTGLKTISAGLERNLEANIRFPRLGSATLNVLPGIDNYAVIRLRPAGSISGRVLDAAGNPVPNTRVAIPQENGFLWVEADSEGNYLFENLGLGHYELSAPGPAVGNTDTSGLIDQIRGGSEDEILAAIGEAFAIFTGASDPFLNGEGDNFNPLTWGYTEATLRVDGEVVVADIRFLREGTVSGVVLNPQGVPIGARVRLTGIGPLQNGAPSMVIRAERNSDPALGTFEFPKQLLAGPWGLQAASPFFQVVITAHGQATSVDPDATNIVLQFPPNQDDKGPLMGRVFYPDGSLVGEGVPVHVSMADDYIVHTDTNGVYRTSPLFAGDYTATADDLATGFKGRSTVRIKSGMTNVADIRLLGKGDVTVIVKLADGSPATNASVTINQSGFPRDEAAGRTDSDGRVEFANLFEGSYAVQASQVVGPVTIQGRSGAIVPLNGHSTVTVFLAPTGKIQGTFVKRDRITPVGFAQVAIGNIGFATTDAEGRFEVDGIPLGAYRLRSQDPVSGVGAVANVTLSFSGEVQNVLLVEQFRGEVNGMVINSYGDGFVPGAQVTLRTDDGFTPPRTVTTGPDGRFSFPGTPAGTFQISAEDPITKLGGSRTGSLPENTDSVTLNIPLQPLGNVFVQVFEPDGVTPAANATVSITGPRISNPDTDETGLARVRDLPLGSYQVRAFSMAQGRTRSGGQTNVLLTTAGSTNQAVVVLAGVGTVSGKVFWSDGTTELPGAEVRVEITAPLFANQRETVLADGEGEFSIGNIPVGGYRVVAQAEALAAGVNDTISAEGETDFHSITLGSSGRIIGRLLRSGSLEAVANIDVLISFQSQSGLPGQSVVRSGTDGEFAFNNVPEGPFSLRAVAPQFAGIIILSSAVEGNGVTRDLGDLHFDEEDPFVVSVMPADTTVGVPVTTVIDLVFNEAIDETTLDDDGIYLRYGPTIVPAEIELLPNPANGTSSLVRLTPSERLISKELYEVVVVDGERRNAVGTLIGSGPRDLAGRSTVIPFISSFTTADNDPPVLLALFPTNSSVQIDPRTVVRLTFDEPVQETSATFSLIGPAGEVSGELAATLNGFALTFVPQAALNPNATYTLRVEGVRDLAGNEIAEPIEGTFDTLDTEGPAVATLAIGGGKQPIAGTTVPLEATLAEEEEGVVVRFTQDLTPVGISTNPPFAANITLPNSGSTVIRAIATDRFGNDGELKELTIQTTSNQPPVIQFVRVTPLSGPVPSGDFVSIDVIASDDSQVTELRAIATGALRSERQGTNSSRIRIQGLVADDVAPGEEIQIHASAIDDSGLSSGEQSFTTAVSDGTEPVVAIIAPAGDETIASDSPFQLSVRTSDNSSQLELRLELTGGIIETQTVALVLQPNSPATNIFLVPLEEILLDGRAVTADVVAVDAAGNAASTAVTFRLPDIQPPAVVAVTPEDLEVDVELMPTVRFEFSEPLSGIDNSAIEVLLDGEQIDGIVSLASSNLVVQWVPNLPLQPGQAYALRLTESVTDSAGNPVTPLESQFTVTPFNIVQPSGLQQVVEGQLLAVAAEGNNRGGVPAVYFNFNGISDALAPAPSLQSNLIVPLLADLGEAAALLDADALVSNPERNLLVNAGCDESIENDGIPGWTEVVGANWTQRRSGPAPHSGPGYFFAGSGAEAELRQDVDVTHLAGSIDAGEQAFGFGGYVNSWGDGDRSRVIVEYWSEEKGSLLDSFDSGDRNGTAWSEISDARFAPAGTRIISVRLVSTRNSGSNNDGYFDSLSLSALLRVPLPPVALEVHPSGDDSDSDGVTNGMELALGSNPFFAESDTDGDGLANVDEAELGTHPGKADTDEDGLNDSSEIAAGTDPLNTDTDGDGVPDGTDPNPTDASTVPTLIVLDAIETVEGQETNLLVTVNDADGNLSRITARSSIGLEGLTGQFHNIGSAISALGEINFAAEPTFTQVLSQLNLTSEPFWPGGPDSFYALRAFGNVSIRESGEYQFFTSSDDGSQMFINGQLVVNNDGLHGVTERSGVIALEEGYHSFEVTFFENGGGAWLQAHWQGPGFTKELMPTNAFFTPMVHWEGALDVIEITNVPTFQVIGKLIIDPMPAGTSVVDIAVIDADLLTATQQVTVVTLPDLDKDALPDRDDSDIDGDGLSNDDELAASADPRNPDSDGDTVLDGADLAPLVPNTRPLAGNLVDSAALEFDGTNDFLYFGHPSVAQRESFTVAAWFENTDRDFVDGQGNYLISKGPLGSAPWNDYSIQYRPDNTISFLVVNESVTAFSVTSPPLSEGTHHVAATYDPARQRMTLFIDGIQVAESPASGRIRHSNEAFLIGDWNGNSTWHYWRGWIDEVQLWNRALSLNEVRGVMGRRLSGVEPGLALYFPFDEGQGGSTVSAPPNTIIASLGQGQAGRLPAWISQPIETAAPATFSVPHNSNILLHLAGHDAENNALTAEIRTLPSHGKLYMDDGAGQKGEEITSVPSATGTERSIIYEPETGFAGRDAFTYAVFDGQEFSGESEATLIITPSFIVPEARADIFAAFEETPLVLDPLANDLSSGPIEIVFFTQPANGRLTRDTSGNLKYEPNIDFSGSDTFTYAVATDVFWNRFRDWSGGVTHGSSAGLPDDGLLGLGVWNYEFVNGGPLTDPAPWFAAPGIQLVWDSSWFGGGGLWSRGNDVSPPIGSTGLTHVLDSSTYASIPMVKWISPFDNYRIDLRGNLTVVWSGAGAVGSPVDIDVAVAHYDGTNSTLLYSDTVSKPTPGDTANDQVVIPVSVSDLLLQRGHEIRVTLRGQSSMGSRWINLYDDLYILPHSPSNTTTASIEVIPNNTPVTSVGSDKFALWFDGSNDYVDLGNPPNLQITGDQTIEFWINLTSYNGRQNPIAKAYGGEGTMTIEGDGSINYFYGTNGGNGQPYQGFTSSRVIPLGVWTHIALVRDLTNGRLRWYFDGQPAGEAAADFPVATAGVSSWSIGRGYVNHLAGAMDELRIWSIARSEAEISEAMWQRLDGTQSGLELYFNFDEGTGLATSDLTSNGLTGMLAGNSGAGDAPLWIKSVTPFDTALITLEDTDLVLTLSGTDADGDALTPLLSEPIDAGLLYQTADGVSRGALVAVSNGTALQFDGVDDLIVIPESAENDLSRSAEWSITAWIKPNNSSRDNPTIYSEGHWGISLGLQRNTGKLDSWVNSANQGLSTAAVQFGQWSHVAVVSTASERRFYINGTFAGSGPLAAASPNDSGAAIGGVATEVSNLRNRFDGVIDEVITWRKALSDLEITTLSTGASITPDSTVAGYWKFDEASGAITMDSTAGAAVGSLGAGTASYQPRWVVSTLPDLASFRAPITNPAHQAIYAPLLNFSGQALLKYRVHDGKVESPEGTVIVRVVPVNDAPVASPDTNITVEGFSITTANVLLNDTDVENQPLTILDFTQPANGIVMTNGHGTFLYSPAAGFVGEDSFTYRATDGISNSASVTVHITVRGREPFRWTNPEGGLWHVAANWSGGVVPGAGDIAVVDLEGDYTVRINGGGDVRRFVFGGASGEQRLVIESNFRVREGSRVGSNATLEFRAGDLTGDGLIQIARHLDWLGGNCWELGGFEIENTATASISGGGDRYLLNGRRLINHGELTISSTRLMLDNRSVEGALVENHSTITLLNGGQFFWNNHTSARPVFLRNFGTITHSGTATHSVIAAPYSGPGLVEVPEGLLVIAHNFNLEGTLRVAVDAAVSVQGGHFFVSVDGTLDFEGRLDLAGTSGSIRSSSQLPWLRVLNGSWEFQGDSTVQEFALSGGDLTGAGNLIVAGRFDWSGGNMWDSGTVTVGADAVAEISGSGDRYLINARTIRNLGTLVINGPRVMLDNRAVAGSAILNEGALQISGGSSIFWNNHTSARPVVFRNLGTFEKIGGGVAEVTAPMVNLGSTTVDEGTLRIRGGISNTGQFDVAGGSTLALSGGSSNFDVTGLITGDGLISLEEGNASFASSIATSGMFAVSGGDWAFNSFQMMARLDFTGGNIMGTGVIQVTNQFNWSRGNMWDAGVLQIAETATGLVTVATDHYLVNGRKLENRGTLIIKEGRILLDNRTIAGASLENRGTLITEEEVDILWNNHTSSRPVSMHNSGTWRKVGAPGAVTQINAPFSNEGLLHIEGGDVRLDAGVSLSGIIQIDAGARLHFNQGHSVSTEEGSIIGAGEVLFQNGSSEFLNSFDLTGPTTVSGGTWRLNTNVVLREVNISGGDFGGLGQLTILSNLNWTGGRMSEPGETIIASGATAFFTGSNEKVVANGRKFINRGTVEASSGNIVLDNPQLAGATFQNENKATFTGEIDFRWNNHSSSRPVLLRNSGRLIKAGAGTTTTVGMFFENTGRIEIQEGTLAPNAGSSQSGQWQIEPSGVLHLQNGSFSLANLTVEGTGQLNINSPIELQTDVNLGALQVVFQTSSITGSHTLANTAGGRFLVPGSVTTFGGSLDIGGVFEMSGNQTINVVGVLTLQASGTIINPGTIRVGVFTDLGGTIQGNTPIEVGLPPPPLRIESITVDNGGGLRALSVNAAVLEWRGLPKSAYIIETSYSLPAWTKVETLVEEFAPGRYRAAVPRVNGNAFFRIARQR